jgi:hypothetical protein
LADAVSCKTNPDEVFRPHQSPQLHRSMRFHAAYPYGLMPGLEMNALSQAYQLISLLLSTMVLVR